MVVRTSNERTTKLLLGLWILYLVKGNKFALRSYLAQAKGCLPHFKRRIGPIHHAYAKSFSHLTLQRCPYHFRHLSLPNLTFIRKKLSVTRYLNMIVVP